MMKPCRLFVLCAALFAWSLVVGAPAKGRGYQQSGITGQVQGPILFHNWNVLVTSEDGKRVIDLVTAADGCFEVGLKPGTYVLTAYITNFDALHPVVWGTPVTVTVEKKEFSTAVLPITLPPL